MRAASCAEVVALRPALRRRNQEAASGEGPGEAWAFLGVAAVPPFPASWNLLVHWVEEVAEAAVLACLAVEEVFLEEAKVGAALQHPRGEVGAAGCPASCPWSSGVGPGAVAAGTCSPGMVEVVASCPSSGSLGEEEALRVVVKELWEERLQTVDEADLPETAGSEQLKAFQQLNRDVLPWHPS